jgi:hypothetical protein
MNTCLVPHLCRAHLFINRGTDGELNEVVWRGNVYTPGDIAGILPYRLSICSNGETIRRQNVNLRIPIGA